MMNRREVRKERRTGLRIRGERGDPEVRSALVSFARWLRSRHEFPIRLPVYLHPGEHVTTGTGERVSASFFAPWDRSVEPFIRIATGEYRRLKRRMDRDNALASHVLSLAHEVVHYFQWVTTGEIREQGVPNQAGALLRRYAQETGIWGGHRWSSSSRRRRATPTSTVRRGSF